MRGIISVLVISMLILGGAFFAFGTGVESDGKVANKSAFRSSYIEHEPLRINNDTEFFNMAGVENWSGDGSSASPFMIENYTISGSGYGYGIYVGNTTVHFIVKNCYLRTSSGGFPPYFGGMGLILYNVSNALIASNRMQGNLRYGLYIRSSHNVSIESNYLSTNNYGAYLIGSQSDVILLNNTFHLNRYAGLYLQGCDGTQVINNTFQDNRMLGAYLYISTGIVMRNNSFSGDGIYIRGSMQAHWDSHIIEKSNMVNGKPVYYLSGENGGRVPGNGGEVIIASSSHLTIENQSLGHTSVSILAGYSWDITVSNVTAHNDTFDGIYMYMCDNSLIHNVTFRDNMQGVSFDTSHDITIRDSTFRDNMRGLWLVVSTRITVSGNDFGNNNIMMSGNSAEYWDSHAIDNTNTANGKPLLYLAGISNYRVNGTYGEVIIISSSHMIVENVSVEGGDAGLILGYSSSIIVRDSSFTRQSLYNLLGEHLTSSRFHRIAAEEGEIYGAFFRYSDNNVISNSSFSENNYGMIFYRSNSNVVRNSTFQNNFFDGLRILFGNGNRIYHNDFLGNRPNAYDSSGNNFWNTTYPTGGNYWSDYTGTDDNGDGIGDTPYTSGNVVDHYPLMSPVNIVIPELTWIAVTMFLALALALILLRRRAS